MMSTDSGQGLHAVICVVLGAALVLVACFLYLNPQIPDATRFIGVQLQTPLRIFSHEGLLVAEYGSRRRVPISLSEIPPTYVQATIDIEDKRFYDHAGVDFISLFNASIRFLTTGRIQGGASTITMQVARNLSLSRKQLFIRKFKEILLALKLERELGKKKILELYFNLIPFGKRAYGVEAASLIYYGKSARDLNLPQIAMLAGIPQAPTSGNPINNPQKALARRNLVLRRMLTQNTITEAEYAEAVVAPVTARLHASPNKVSAPWFAEEIRVRMLEKFGPEVYEGGYEVHTTLRGDMQAAANKATRQGIYDYDQRHGYRGPEARLSTPADLAAAIETVATAVAVETAETIAGSQSLALPEKWQQRMAQAPIVEGLTVGVVAVVHEQSFDAFLPDGSLVTVQRDGFVWARRYVDENTMGNKPARASVVVRPGFLIRLQQKDGVWFLRQLPEIQAALVAMSPKDGAIQALVGGFDFTIQQFNHALHARRQPGSSFKPFIYAAGLHGGITPADFFNDAPLVFEDEHQTEKYRPKNSGGSFRGPTRVREAFYLSINLVTMRVLLATGIQPTLGYLERFGFDTANFPADVQLALGGGSIEVAPIDMAKAYTPFANGGYLKEPYFAERVERIHVGIIEQRGASATCNNCPLANVGTNLAAATLPDEAVPMSENVITAPASVAQPDAPDRSIDPRIAFQIKSFMQDVIRRGTGRRALALGRDDLAGKTGTTNSTDAWFNGFNDDLVISVWLGFTDNRPIGHKEFGASAALPIWMDFVAESLPREPENKTVLWPEGLVRVLIDRETGLQAKSGNKTAEFEWFRTENAPQWRQSKQSKSVVEDKNDAVNLMEIF